MAVFSIELPDKRVIDIEAADEATAMRGAQEWFQSNDQSQQASTSKPGFWGRAVDMVTGTSRNQLGDRPEFLQAYMNESAGSGPVSPDAVMRSGVTPDQNAQLDILKKNIPGLEHQLDQHGNLMLKAPGMKDWSYLNAPGISGRDLDEIGTQTLATLPFLGAAGRGATTATRAATGTAGLAGASVAQDVMATAQGSEQGIDPLRAGISAVAGGVTAPGVPTAIGQGIKSVGEKIASPFRGAFKPEAEAARRVAQAVDADARMAPPLLPQERQTAAATGQDLRVMDTGGPSTSRLARQAANVSPEAEQTLNSVINKRYEEQGPRTAEFVRDLIQTPGRASQTRQELQQIARTSRAPYYQRAYTEGSQGISDPTIAGLMEAPVFQEAMKVADRMMQNRATTQRFTTGRAGPNGPTLEYFDNVKRALDDTVDSLMRSGERAAATDASDIRTQLVNALDLAVPSYKEARGVAATIFKASDALEAGEKFATEKFNNDVVRGALGKMTANERTMFREGYASKLSAMIDEATDRSNVITRFFNSPAARERVEIALGPNAARQLETFKRVETIMDRMRGAVQGNSTTAKQLWDLAAIGAGSGLGGVGYYTNDPYALFGAALLAGGRYGKVKLEQRLATKVAEMLASKDPSVVQKAITQIAHSPMLNALRKVDDVLEKAGIGRNIGILHSSKNS